MAAAPKRSGRVALVLGGTLGGRRAQYNAILFLFSFHTGSDTVISRYKIAGHGIVSEMTCVFMDPGRQGGYI